jgi:hypothetical protein
MKKAVLLIGFAMFLVGSAFAQVQNVPGKKVAEGDTFTPFGKYKIEADKEPIVFDGEKATRYRITYENSPISVIVVVDKEEKCKNYIVVSNGLSVMYTCNGMYFGINRIDEKYKKDGCITDVKNLDQANYFHQKVLVLGQQEELYATGLIATYYPALIKTSALTDQ